MRGGEELGKKKKSVCMCVCGGGGYEELTLWELRKNGGFRGFYLGWLGRIPG